MIKRGLINFLKGLKYYLTPYGSIFLFLAIGFCIAIPGWIGAITKLFSDVTLLFKGITYNWDDAKTSIFNSVMSLDWKNGVSQSISTMLSSDFLKKMLYDATAAAFGRSDVKELIVSYVETCISTLIFFAVVILIFFVIGTILGFVFTRMQLRHEIASTKTKPLRFLLRTLLDAVAFVLFLFLATWISSLLNTVPTVIIIIITMIIYAFLTLFKAYLVYGAKRIKFRKVVNPLQVLLLYAADLIILASGVVLCLLLFFIFNAAIAIIIGIPLAMITLIVMDLNAESYVKELADKDGEEPVKKHKKKEKIEIQ